MLGSTQLSHIIILRSPQPNFVIWILELSICVLCCIAETRVEVYRFVYICKTCCGGEGSASLLLEFRRCWLRKGCFACIQYHQLET